MAFKLSNLNSNLALTLGYLNPALNNSALGLNLPERNAVVGSSVGSAVVSTVVGLAVVSGFGQQHLVFFFQQENLSQHASVPGGQGLPLLMHLAPSLSLTQELRRPVKINL